METSLVEQARQQAIRTRGFVPGQDPHLCHSDQGSQYASHLFQEALVRAGTRCGMSRCSMSDKGEYYKGEYYKGECYDNAVAESFFGTCKAELLADQPQRRFTSKLKPWCLRHLTRHAVEALNRAHDGEIGHEVVIRIDDQLCPRALHRQRLDGFAV